MDVILTRDAEKKILAEISASGGVLNGATLHLFTNTAIVSDRTVADDLTEPVFTGYSPLAATLVGPINTPGGGALGVNHTFVCTAAPSAPVTCYGWYLLSTETPARLLYVANFDTPVTVASPGDYVEVEGQLNLTA